MDNIIKKYNTVPFGELSYCIDEGIMYQTDMTQSVEYDKDYFEKYIGYEDTNISKGINDNRISLTEKYCKTVLDIGIGSGEFIKKSNVKVFGYDINPYGIAWLKEKELYVNPYLDDTSHIEGWSFWDTLEHITHPHELWGKLLPNKYVFISIPIFDSLLTVKGNKHYRPNEHYYYFTLNGFKKYMEDTGFEYIEHNDKETLAGREGILTFVFLKK